MRPLANRLNQITPSASMAMAQRISASTTGSEIIDLTWGQPDFDTPSYIKEAAWKAVQAGQNGYTPSTGIPQLRTAIADFYKHHYQAFYNPKSEVLVTPGAKQGLMYLMQTLVNPGDEVILFEPCWLSYRDMILLNEGIPKFIPTKKDLVPDLDKFEKTINSRTKAVLINNPINPSGYVFNKNELERIGRIAEQYDLYIIADEIYDRIAFAEFVSFSEFKDLRKRLVIANGFSKAYAMTGWRIGYLLGDEKIIAKAGLIHQHTATCAAAQSQYAALAALENSQDQVRHMTETYRKRRDFMIDGLKDAPFTLVSPDGTFYAMLEVSTVLGTKAGENAEKLLTEYGIASVEGISYGQSAGSYVRLSLTKDTQLLETVLKRLKRK